VRNVRAGGGAADLRIERDRLEVLSNTTGFQIVPGPAPQPSLPESVVGNELSRRRPRSESARPGAQRSDVQTAHA